MLAIWACHIVVLFLPSLTVRTGNQVFFVTLPSTSEKSNYYWDIENVRFSYLWISKEFLSETGIRDF